MMTPRISVRLSVLIAVAVTLASGAWLGAKAFLENPTVAPYTRANMDRCPLPAGDTPGVWSLGETSGERPFIGLDGRFRYKNGNNRMHVGDCDEVMAAFSRANGLWGLKWEQVPAGAQVLIAIQDLPAGASGLRSGDTIIAINGASLVGKTPDVLSSLLQSRPDVRLTVSRGNETHECVIQSVSTAADNRGGSG